MQTQPRIVQAPAQKTAIVSITCPRSEIRNVMGPGLQEVYATLRAQGIAAAGPWLSHHLRMDPNRFEFEISVPVADVIKPSGRVKPSELPAAKVARTVYNGPYEGLGQAWAEFKAWVLANGHQAAPNLWEVYLAGPESSANPQDWKTELNQPLIA